MADPVVVALHAAVKEDIEGFKMEKEAGLLTSPEMKRKSQDALIEMRTAVEAQQAKRLRAAQTAVIRGTPPSAAFVPPGRTAAPEHTPREIGAASQAGPHTQGASDGASSAAGAGAAGAGARTGVEAEDSSNGAPVEPPPSGHARDVRLVPLVSLDTLTAPFGGLWVPSGDDMPIRVYNPTVDSATGTLRAATSDDAGAMLQDFGALGDVTSAMAKLVKNSLDLTANEKTSLLAIRLKELKHNRAPHGWSGSSLGMMAQQSKPISASTMSRMCQPDIANPNGSFYEPSLALSFRFMFLLAANGSTNARIEPAALGFSGDATALTGGVGGNKPPPKEGKTERWPPEIAKAVSRIVKAHKNIISDKVKKAMDANDASLLPSDTFPQIKEVDYDEIITRSWKDLVDQLTASVVAAGKEEWKKTKGLKDHIHKKWSDKKNAELKRIAEQDVRKARREIQEASRSGGGGGGGGGGGS